MGKQPHVWVVESKVGKWVPCRAYLSEGAAKGDRDANNFWYKITQFRVAKYVRVEPKKGRKR